jgi:hypothetical protein
MMLLSWLALCPFANADVKVFSLLPDDSQVRWGERELSLSHMQSHTLPGGTEVNFIDPQGKTVCQAKLTDQRVYVIHPQGLTEAGSAVAPPGKHFAFFNANNYGIQLALYPGKDEEEDCLAEIPAPSLKLTAPALPPEGQKWKVYLRDEGGNPLGTSYTPVRPGHIYLIYRKRPSLYDIEYLGTLP